MAGISSVIGSFLGKIKGFFSDRAKDSIEEVTIYEEGAADLEEIHSIWDYLKFRENTQAFHLTKVIGFEEWVSMNEIIRRIKELFGIEYKNQRSLYPYLKTLVDCGLFESTDIGGTRKWRKKDLIIKVEKKEKEKVKQAAEQKIVKKKETN